MLRKRVSTLKNMERSFDGSLKMAYTIWFTGLQESGKDDIAKKLLRMLRYRGIPVVFLDDEITRVALSYETVQTKYSSENHTVRVARLSYILSSSGVLNLVTITVPRRKMRHYARMLIKDFVEISVTKEGLKDEEFEDPPETELSFVYKGSPDKIADEILEYLTKKGAVCNEQIS